MKMTSKKMKNLLCEQLAHSERTFLYDAEKEELRVENRRTNKGITISLPPIVAKAENALESTVAETVYYVTEALKVMGNERSLKGHENDIFPVIRSTSFPMNDQDGRKFVTNEHTAETRIYYALDLGNTYRLIDETMLADSGWELGQLNQYALGNLYKKPITSTSDTVAGNVFHFVSTKDGYDASKILNEDWLQSMKAKIVGEMAVAVPHGDVCIVADIRNNTGYDVLAQMCMSFFASGSIPITALSFLYQNNQLEPIFILGKNKQK
ncbi:MAG: DUF1444 domain-containing protein [Bacillus sp. (in: firmicutes)]